jgi:hypothetical protein
MSGGNSIPGSFLCFSFMGKGWNVPGSGGGEPLWGGTRLIRGHSGFPYWGKSGCVGGSINLHGVDAHASVDGKGGGA